MPREMVVVENVNHPGHTTRIDAVKYEATRAAMSKVLPRKAPGLTQDEMMREMRKALPTSQFPGTTTSWWTKMVQLDLEAKGLVLRDSGKPLRWRRV
jgi:hypothetical protein